jgi:hypothetical protein
MSTTEPTRDAGEQRWQELTEAERDAEQTRAVAAFHLERKRRWPVPDRRQVLVQFLEPHSDEPAWVAEYNASHTWDELLGGDGWQRGHTDRDGTVHWVRPGKDRETGATTGHSGIDKLHVFTTSISWLPSDDGYTRWAYMVHRDFDGDFRAASRSMRGGR